MKSLPGTTRSKCPKDFAPGRTTTTASFGYLDPCAGGNLTPINREECPALSIAIADWVTLSLPSCINNLPICRLYRIPHWTSLHSPRFRLWYTPRRCSPTRVAADCLHRPTKSGVLSHGEENAVQGKVKWF